MSGPARWAYASPDDVWHLLAPGSDPPLGLVVNGDELAVRCRERLPRAVIIEEAPPQSHLCPDCELHAIADTEQGARQDE